MVCRDRYKLPNGIHFRFIATVVAAAISLRREPWEKLRSKTISPRGRQRVFGRLSSFNSLSQLRRFLNLLDSQALASLLIK